MLSEEECAPEPFTDGVRYANGYKKGQCRRYFSFRVLILSLLGLHSLLLGFIFSGLLVAGHQFQSIDATVGDVRNIIPLVRTTLEPLGAVLATIDVEQVGRLVEDLPDVAIQIRQLLALGKNITREMHRYFPAQTRFDARAGGGGAIIRTDNG